MTAYVSFLLIMFTVEMIGKLIMLATGKMPTSKPAHVAFEVFIAAGLIAWGLVLLF